MKNFRFCLMFLGLFTPLISQAQSNIQSQSGENIQSSAKTIARTYSDTLLQPKIFYGGGFGLVFGDVDYFEIWPMIGINLTQALSVGVQFLYRHRKDKRYQQTLTTDDYGTTLFGRYRFSSPFYLQAEYEYLDYQYYVSTINGLTTKRDNLSSFMAGGGVYQAVGANTSVYATVLYNFSYDQNYSPYYGPWITRFGIGVGF
jgi:hypothetical protein